MSSNSTSPSSTLLDTSKVEETVLPPPLDGLRRDGEFWIEDGNLILVAKDVAFRIYRSLLAKQSAVLAGMATTASEDLKFELFDGCPVVHLSDSPQDWIHLLSILIPMTRRRQVPRLHPQDEEDHSPDELSALVRLSHRYEIHDVEEQALNLLREYYAPDDFDEWCSIHEEFLDRPFSKPCAHFIGIVNIAWLTDTPSLLPAALYFCSLLGAALVDGWKREDGSVEHLSTDDLKRCFTAQECLCREGIKVMCQIFEAPSSTGCLSPAECSSRLSAVLRSSPPLRTFWALSNWGKALRTINFKVCSKCKDELELRDEKTRRQLWNKLPEIFGIEVPGWGKTVHWDISG